MASLNSAINTSVSGLNAQGSNIATISNNISNSDTFAYKSTETYFSSLVTGSGANASGSVTTGTTVNIQSQGGLTPTSVATNMAIQGNGFFAVTDSPTNDTTSTVFTRNGTFTTDKEGFLVNNEGQYLLGQPTNASGVVTVPGTNSVSSLSPVNVNASRGTAKATSALAIGANLPANAVIGGSYTTSTTVYDALGVSSDVTFTWTKNGANDWTLGLSDPVLTSDGTTVTGTISPNTVSITFNGDGTIATPTAAAILSVTGWTSGSNPSTISVNLGTPGKADQLTQYNFTGTNLKVSVSSITNDGVPFGKLSGLSIDSSGLVTARYDNGLKQPVYQIALATFTNANGLSRVNGSIYEASSTSGSVVLERPGEGTSGEITASAVEASNTDTTTELSKLVVAQNNYSASSKVISTVSQMYDALLQAI
jgi:flagellar hook protein FlgE